jgi:hypothetical protein
VWAYLERTGRTFIPQMKAAGGRMVRGGSVLDFVIYDLAAKPVVIRIQGAYWHTRPGRRENDDGEAANLRAGGMLVCDLWEPDVYREALTGHLLRLIEYALRESL